MLVLSSIYLGTKVMMCTLEIHFLYGLYKLMAREYTMARECSRSNKRCLKLVSWSKCVCSRFMKCCFHLASYSVGLVQFLDDEFGRQIYGSAAGIACSEHGVWGRIAGSREWVLLTPNYQIKPILILSVSVLFFLQKKKEKKVAGDPFAREPAILPVSFTRHGPSKQADTPCN